ncbi:MAG: hypothetical protein AAF902_23355, partial [Chloroflexota bacterium]
FASAAFWGGAGIMLALEEEAAAFSVGSLAVDVMYIIFCSILFYLLKKRAEAFDTGEILMD